MCPTFWDIEIHPRTATFSRSWPSTYPTDGGYLPLKGMMPYQGAISKLSKKPQVDLGFHVWSVRPSTHISWAGLYAAIMSRFSEAFSKTCQDLGGFPFQINAPALTALCPEHSKHIHFCGNVRRRAEEVLSAHGCL